MCLWLNGALCEQGACSSATEALMARQDGCTYAGAAQLLQQVDRADSEPAHTGKDAAVQLSCRRILLQLTMLKVRLVCCACKLHACAVLRLRWRQIIFTSKYLTHSGAGL